MPKKKLKKFSVTVEYRAKVTVEVEASDEANAERKAMEETDETAALNLSVWDVKAEEQERS